MNLKIKFRESFRPFAPSVLRERVDEFFEMRDEEESPYMLLVADVQKEKRTEQTEEQKSLFGIDKLKVKRSVVPAITHVDYSARVQTVDSEKHDTYYKLIKKFEEKTGSCRGARLAGGSTCFSRGRSLQQRGCRERDAELDQGPGRNGPRGGTGAK